jgi:hypothetical protein
MAGRRWAQGKADPDAEAAKARPRPSERSSAADAPPAGKRKRYASEGPVVVPRKPKAGRQDPTPEPSKPAKASGKKRAKPTPEQIAAARERLAPPKAPWHPLPLAELSIVLGFIAMLAAAALSNLNGAAAGFCLIVIGTAEFSWREHKHGYRSHATVLAASAALLVATVMWRVIELSRNLCLGVAVAVFLVAWGALDRAYVPRRDREAAEALTRADGASKP